MFEIVFPCKIKCNTIVDGNGVGKSPAWQTCKIEVEYGVNQAM